MRKDSYPIGKVQGNAASMADARADSCERELIVLRQQLAETRKREASMGRDKNEVAEMLAQEKIAAANYKATFQETISERDDLLRQLAERDKKTECLRRDIGCLEDRIAEWKEASDLIAGGDPEGVTPVMLEASRSKDDAEIERLRTAGYPFDREFLGRLVRMTWVEWAKEEFQHNTGANVQAHWLEPWEKLSERMQEVDRLIGEKIANVVCAILERENKRLRETIIKVMATLEEAAKENPHCLGTVAPPVDRDGIPEGGPWPVIDEMIANFRKVLPTGQAGATEKKQVAKPTTTMMGEATRTVLPRCQYGVPGNGAECGEPAVAEWTWPGSSTNFYVCKRHDKIVEEAEMNDQPSEENPS